jgi:hypothetical protein
MRRRDIERAEGIGQFAGVEAVQTGSVSGRVPMIEKVEKRWLPQRGLFSNHPLRRPPVQGVPRCGQYALLHVGAGIKPQELFGQAAIVANNQVSSSSLDCERTPALTG